METHARTAEVKVSIPTGIRRYLVTRADKSQVLIERYPDGRVSVAFRDDPYGSWGPPHPAEEMSWTA